MTLKAEKFEEILGTELKAALDPERGKALAAFRGYVAAEEARGRSGGGETGALTADFRRGGEKQVSRREMWMWTTVPSLAAACLGVVVTLKVVGMPGGAVIQRPVEGVGPTMVGNVDAGVSHPVVGGGQDMSRGLPGGIVVSDHVVAPQVRTETVRQWVDPKDHAVYRVVEPATEPVQGVPARPF